MTFLAVFKDLQCSEWNIIEDPLSLMVACNVEDKLWLAGGSQARLPCWWLWDCQSLIDP